LKCQDREEHGADTNRKRRLRPKPTNKDTKTKIAMLPPEKVPARLSGGTGINPAVCAGTNALMVTEAEVPTFAEAGLTLQVMLLEDGAQASEIASPAPFTPFQFDPTNR
jgi:hypothetical protein